MSLDITINFIDAYIDSNIDVIVVYELFLNILTKQKCALVQWAGDVRRMTRW